MIRLPAAAVAIVLFVLPLLTAAKQVVAVTGAIGLLLVAVGIAGPWRWPITAAACVFLTNYAAVVWVVGAPVSVAGAVGFGLSLLLLLEFAELSRWLRRAAIDTGVVRSQLVGWAGFGAATLAATMLVMTLSGSLVTRVPVAVAPFLAAVGTLGVMLALAAALTGASRRVSSAPSTRPGPPISPRNAPE